MKEAFEPFNAADIVFLVLTLDPQEHHRGKTDLAQVYKEFTRRGANLLKRFRRWMKKNRMEPFGSEWVSTIEAHKSGVPHINYMVHSPDLTAMLRADAESRRVGGESNVDSIIIQGELRQHLQACGFGWRSTAEAVRLDDDAKNGVSKLAGYITKIAGNSEKTHGELAKLSQVPVMAPKNFRRLRSGKKFLPKRRKGDMTGALLRRYPSKEGDEVAEAVTRSPDPEYMAHVRACVKQEQELVFEDERRVATNRFFVRWGLPPSPIS